MLKKSNLVLIISLLSVSLVFNFYYGSLGVFPIDTFAFFDSANFINKGFSPTRDYWTSNGFFVDLIQSVFFKILGVNWYVYLLHSSLVNFLLAFFTFKFLRREGLKFKIALFYSVSVGILAYPSVGVPFPDHHSLIFSIISIYCLKFFFQKQSNTLLFIIILLLFVAFLCKQVPAAFYILLSSFYLIIFSLKKKDYLLIFKIIFFTLSILLIFFLLLKINNFSITNFLIQYIDFPLSIGFSRTNSFDMSSFVLSLFKEFKFFLLIFLILLYQAIKTNKNKSYLNETNIIFIFTGFISLINQEIMKNQNIVFFLLPILIGIIHSKIETKKNKNNLFFLSLLIVFNIFITFKYHEKFNVDRKFMDLQNIDKSKTIKASNISEKLKGLRWVTLTNQTKIKDEVKLLQDSIEFLRLNKNNSMIISHYQFINSEINHSVYSPNRWYTADGVSYPLKDNKFFDYYVDFFKTQLVKNQISKIYTIYPLNEKSFNFVLKSNCIKTREINTLLSEHLLINCF